MTGIIVLELGDKVGSVASYASFLVFAFTCEASTFYNNTGFTFINKNDIGTVSRLKHGKFGQGFYLCSGSNPTT